MKWLGALIAVVALSLDAGAQEASRSAPMTREEADAYMLAYFGSRPLVRGAPCPLGARRIDQYSIDDTGITIRCPNGQEHVIAFQDAPQARVAMVVGSGVTVGRQGSTRFEFFGMEDEQQFIAAWGGLQRPAAPRDPLTDTAFQEALRRAASDPVDRSEENRRTQVQVEALIAANRVDAALSAYRAALDISPDWAAGHYNAALVAGQLERYGLAITEMRRYLYLQPNAPDARAAQDQIYRWEALLPQP